MKAVTYQGLKNVSVKEVKDPAVEKADDIIVKITASAICGSDLHLIHGLVPNMPTDYVIGHEPVGIVEETGPDVTKVKKGDRVIIPFNVSCGECWYCKNDITSQCDHSNPHGEMGGFFGYSETTGGYAGGQAEYLRVPYGNFTPFKIPESCELEDEKLVLLSDAASTAYWSVIHAEVKSGDTVVILGCGPVGLLAQKFAWMKGAERVIAVDHLAYRLQHAERTNKVETVNLEQHENVGEHLKDMTKGGADVVIDCSGMSGKMTPMEFLASGLKLHGGAMGGIVIASQAVRKAGTIQVTGVYGGRYNAFPLGDIFQRNVTLRTGQAPVIPVIPELYHLMNDGKVDLADIITHILPLQEAKRGYEVFDTRTDGCIKVVLKP
ncbi:zinc-dependent alcohol dehydrogenase [Bacillus thermotolerans]|uniref:Zinc-type alcohol dehydrogenase-like protein ybdR n=1 Tax=Bacillus thermotolerans TaxID=1221996 RepID=A0A0F5I0A0_BACTR|nr:zinc-dependent alcohol dehydrogenase [Bacillus thermotolerans]KKB34184.1 putative zinc-type alcohol dehydrogenase-like protein ybdR [Bacillus thermotolerans]KKB39069.1 putative zinc-type alcohol dehydrogenase-like protein ybdR [Bacillus thermotolerans]